MIWSCPVCKLPLVVEGKNACCDNNHHYDRAKQGYFNLLLANQKHSKDPGDTREMLLSRRAFLNRGYYQPLANRLQKWTDEKLQSGEPGSIPLTILDSGCGEGYYLEQMRNQAPDNLQAFGLDISKEAVRLAAATYKNSEWAVASSFRLPVLDKSVDVVLRNFAPGDDIEAGRVLSDRGELWRAAPGPNHLTELKSRLYNQSRPHLSPEVPGGFRLLEQVPVTFQFHLATREAVQQLLAMTPFVWNAPEKNQIRVQQLDQLAITADFLLERFRPD